MYIHNKHKRHKMSSKQPIKGNLSPTTPGTPVRIALAVESIITVLFGIYWVLTPSHYLTKLLFVPSSQISPVTIIILQWFGLCNFYLGIYFWTLVGNTKEAVGARLAVYRWINPFEFLWMVTMLWQAWSLDDAESGDLRWGVLGLVAMLMPSMWWRAWIIYVRPEWCGVWFEGGKEN